jgi:ACR3 family arsenite transporter
MPNPGARAGILTLVARHGKFFLAMGLVIGIALPGLAAGLRPYLAEMVALQLFLTAFRIGPRAALESLHALGRTARGLAVLQLVLPMAAILLFGALGVMATPLAMVVVLMLAAPTASGTPNFALLLGHEPGAAMRLLILGTALMPLTVLPVFWLLPEVDEIGEVLKAALRLSVVILGATGLAFALRHWRFKTLSPQTQTTLDGATVITLAVLAVALMSAVGPALVSDPIRLARWLVAAFAVNFGFQIATFMVMKRRGQHRPAVAVAIVAGNRNIALFLVALPGAVTDPLLMFIGCYQFPMFLTPILLGRLYGTAKHTA